MPDVDDTLPFWVEVWTDDDASPEEVLALVKSSTVAKAAYEAALGTRPTRIVRLRQKSLEMAVRFPQGLPKIR